MTPRPTVTVRRSIARDEALIELTWADGRGCLVSCFTDSNGDPRVNIYRADAGLVVDVSAPARVVDFDA